MYKKIMVGIDGSEPSNKALKAAAELAKMTGAELHVFHAVPHHYQLPAITTPLIPVPYPSISPQMQYDPATLKRIYEEEGKKVIAQAKKFLEGLSLGIEGQTEFQLELDVSPEEYAVNYATKKKVDLIVVGCKGHHGRLRRALLGTVATKIVNEAPCQVLVTR